MTLRFDNAVSMGCRKKHCPTLFEGQSLSRRDFEFSASLVRGVAF